MEWELINKIAKCLWECVHLHDSSMMSHWECVSLRAAELMVNICKLLLKLLHLRRIQNSRPHHLCSKGSHLINNWALTICFNSTLARNMYNLLERSFEECIPVAIPFEGQAFAVPIHDEPGPFKHLCIYKQDQHCRAGLSRLLKKLTKIKTLPWISTHKLCHCRSHIGKNSSKTYCNK